MHGIPTRITASTVMHLANKLLLERTLDELDKCIETLKIVEPSLGAGDAQYAESTREHMIERHKLTKCPIKAFCRAG